MGNSITDLLSVTTVGLDLAKHVFQVHCVELQVLASLTRDPMDSEQQRKHSSPTRNAPSGFVKPHARSGQTMIQNR